MRITKWGEYGILCSLYLARRYDDPAVGAADIARAQVIPIQYTQQILQRLRKGKIIRSIRGPHGGYRLTREPEKISLKDILYAAEGATFEVICEEKPIHEECSGESCGLGRIWYELREQIDTMLAARSLAMLMKLDAEAQGALVPGPKSGRGASISLAKNS
jgi:Rrf2 family iron-sulfur cluster assembly transcriptional regulator